MPLLRQMRQKWRTAAFVANIEFVCSISTCMSNLVTIGPYLADPMPLLRQMRQKWRTAAFVANIEFVCPISTRMPNLVIIGPYLAKLCHI